MRLITYFISLIFIGSVTGTVLINPRQEKELIDGTMTKELVSNYFEKL